MTLDSHSHSHDDGHGHDDHHEHDSHEEHGHEEVHDGDSHEHGEQDHHHDEHHEGHDHEYEQVTEKDPIPANNLFTDISRHRSSVVSIESFFEFATLHVITSETEPCRDDITQEPPVIIDISKPLKLRITGKKYDFFDIYTSKHFQPKLLELLFLKGQKARLRFIKLQEDYFVPENTIDIRRGQILTQDSFKRYSDIYLLERKWHVHLRRSLSKRKKILQKGGIVFLVFGGIWCSYALTFLFFFPQLLQNTILQFSQDIAIPGIDEKYRALSNTNNKLKWIQEGFRPINFVLNNKFISFELLHQAANALYGTSEVVESIQNIVLLANNFEKEMKKKDPQATLGWILDPEKKEILISGTDFLENERETLIEIINGFEKSLGKFMAIKIPDNPQIEKKVGEAVDILSSLVYVGKYYLENEKDILKLLGSDRPIRYFIMNQNRDEIRANGGFLGSVISVTLHQGKVLQYEPREIYFYDWKIFPYKEEPPLGINNLTNVYGLRDANYYPEFRESMEKMNFFYEKSGGGSLDVFVTFHQGILIEFLKKYGGVTVPEVNITFTAENFSHVMSTLNSARVQFGPSSKDLLFRFVRDFGNMLLAEKDIIGYITLLKRSIDEGEMLVGSRDAEISKFLQTFAPLDTWKSRSDNWFYPVYTNIAGNKSDRSTKRTITHSGELIGACEVQNTLELEASHNFSKEDELLTTKLHNQFSIPFSKREELMTIQGKANNLSFIRVLVPGQASLISPLDGSVDQDYSHSEYTVFSFNQEVKIGGKPSSSKIIYTTRPRNCQSSGYFIKQPGLQATVRTGGKE